MKINNTMTLEVNDPFCGECGDVNIFGVDGYQAYCKRHYRLSKKKNKGYKIIINKDNKKGDILWKFWKK